jgi:2-C-methyl-D-erythritol 4-phosphate cytidylyltransferase
MLGAGSSTRFGLATKKQWLRTKDDPLWLKATKNISSNYNFKEITQINYNSFCIENFLELTDNLFSTILVLWHCII